MFFNTHTHVCPFFNLFTLLPLLLSFFMAAFLPSSTAPYSHSPFTFIQIINLKENPGHFLMLGSHYAICFSLVGRLHDTMCDTQCCVVRNVCGDVLSIAVPPFLDKVAQLAGGELNPICTDFSQIFFQGSHSGTWSCRVLL